MWTETTQPKYERKALRFAGDLTDAEWGVIGPLPSQLTNLVPTFAISCGGFGAADSGSTYR